MRILDRLPALSLLGLLATVFVPGSFAQPNHPPRSMEGFTRRAPPHPEIHDQEGQRRIRALGSPRRRVLLGSLAKEDFKIGSAKAGLEAVGLSRALPGDALASGEWVATAKGERVWRLSVVSKGAASMRVQFRNFDAGAGTVQILGTADESLAGPYTARGPLGNGTFWTDLIAGESVIIAFRPAPTDLSGAVPFQVAAISHLFANALAAPGFEAAAAVPLAAAASCSLDVSCYPEYSDAASAVAMMIFESDGQAYRCSGSLVSSGAEPAQPLFLTANHCIGTEAEAGSLIAIFNYQTSACNGATPSLARSPRVTGATLLQTQPMELGDFTLLRLTAFPNVDVKVLGWLSSEINAGERVIGISHPLGDYKRIAIGQRTRDATIRFAGGEQMPAQKGIQVTWFQGLTQGGSSGSPLLAEIAGRQYVVGTLSAGPAVNENNDRVVCSTRNLIASYGRFAAAYPYLEPYLKSSSTPGASEGVKDSFVAYLNADGTATLAWKVANRPAVQVRVLSPAGPAMTGIEPANGTAVTGDWIHNGMAFYLQDASSGDSSGTAKTLAVVTITGLDK